jgi:hypothetical protein
MHPLVQEILDLVDKIRSKFDELQNKINDALSWVPWGLGWVVDKIHDAWDTLVDRWNEFWDSAALVFGNMGSPDALETSAQGWSTGVGSPVTEQIGNADRALLQADDHWTGQAADSYFPKSQLHKTAMEKVQSTYVDGVSSMLDTMRGGLVKFYGGLVTALIALVGGFIAALASSATIVGIPAGIFIAAGACLVAIGAFYTGGTLLKSDCTSAQTDLIGKMNDNTGFPGGSWPPGAVLTA